MIYVKLSKLFLFNFALSLHQNNTFLPVTFNLLVQNIQNLFKFKILNQDSAKTAAEQHFLNRCKLT